MFTGIIQEIGEIIKIEEKKDHTRFTIKTNSILKKKNIGESIAVDGVCVTITKINKNNFTFDAIPETLKLTNFQKFTNGTEVNLEPSLTLNQSIDGHLVQGHVDTTGIVKSISKNRFTRITINFPKDISFFLAFKGSITINGVSLTISDLQKENFSVDLIPHTIEKTNLGKLKKNDLVNLEVDLIARYLRRQLDIKEKESKYEYLKERGFI